MRHLFLVCFVTPLLSACGQTPAPLPAAPKPAVGSFGVDLAQMDTTVRAGDDFYSYVNGTWLKTFQIPADRARYTTGTSVSERVESDVRIILEELAASSGAPGTVAQKVGDLYAGWMDEAAIESRGTAPLTPYLDEIASIKTRADLMKLIGDIDYTAPFSVGVYPDLADPTRYTVWVFQSGLGMPNRDYYLNKGEKFDAYRAAYRAYVTKLFTLIGDKAPAGSAARVIALENKIAAAAWPPERQRSVKETNNPMDRAALAKFDPAVDWDVVLAGVGLGDAQHFIVNETTAIRDGSKLLDTEPIEAWKAYLAFHLVHDRAADLPRAFDEANFDFDSKTLRGVEKQRDRWKRGITAVDGYIGEGLGELYVKKHFPPEHKAKMDELIANLRAGLKSRLESSAWMDATTRAEALKKLDAFEARIGYPVKWRDYSALAIERGKHFENVTAAKHFEWNRLAARLKQPVDRTEWQMTPQTVNAYYDSQMNQINFPAGILQPPFFDPNADPAVNYGSIGAVIGHEIGHGFDDQGREFDGAGKVRNWWTQETNTKFLEATKRLEAQYAAFCPLEGACVNGQLTMGENIGDLGGLEMAYAAYKLSLGGKDAPVIDGFTGDQRFFLAFSQAWRGKMRDDAVRAMMLTDPHSPPAARGQLPLRNIDAWYAAFGVKEGDKLFLKPEERVKIW
jgi:endothelin-converting enzyme/putative endopeptidase